MSIIFKDNEYLLREYITTITQEIVFQSINSTLFLNRCPRLTCEETFSLQFFDRGLFLEFTLYLLLEYNLKSIFYKVFVMRYVIIQSFLMSSTKQNFQKIDRLCQDRTQVTSVVHHSDHYDRMFSMPVRNCKWILIHAWVILYNSYNSSTYFEKKTRLFAIMFSLFQWYQPEITLTDTETIWTTKRPIDFFLYCH